MRFFLECVTCCTAVSTTSSSTEDQPSSPPTPRTEETRSLVANAPKLSIHRRKKRTASKGAVQDWKPSLFAISEDNAVSTTPQKVVNRQQVTLVGSPRNVKRCGSSSAQVNARTRSHEFSREPLPMAFPAFAVAPFMF